jgi:hypothetical protein
MAVKKIKAVEMTRTIRDAQHEQLKDKTWEERVAFYHQQAQALHQELKEQESRGTRKDKSPALRAS